MKFGLIGYPISHSLSPQLFSRAFPDGGFTYDLIENPSFEAAYSIFLKNYDAVNVTAPFKDAAFLKADRYEYVTGLLKATNLLKKQDGLVYAWNTDYLGVRSVLQVSMDHFKNSDVLVVGCGGAGKAAALAAADLGMSVSILNRTIAKAVDFISSVSGFNKGEMRAVSMDDALLRCEEYGVIIYTIPGRSEGFEKLNLEGKTVFEANYRNPVLAQNQKEGCPYFYISGLKWLEAQADFGFKIMTSKNNWQ